MHKDIGAAIIRQDEAKPAICVEELHLTSWHFLVAFHPIAPPPRPYCAAEQRDEIAASHPITSSARSKNESGIVRPSALAVVRLVTSSNLDACSTGMSPGFVPRRILSTNSAARRN